MEVIIRPMEERDVETVSRIEAECFSMPWSEKAYRDVLQNPNCLYLVAEAEGTVVGMCGVMDVLGEGDISNVAVTGAYRGQGIAGQLMEDLLRLGKERGIEAFTLEVRVGNAAAIHLYQKLGFASVGIRPGFYELPKEDAMIMWLRQ